MIVFCNRQIRRISINYTDFPLDFSACAVYIIQFICFFIQFNNHGQPDTKRERRLNDGE